MAIDRQIYEFFPHTVTIYPFSSKNAYGEDVQSGTGRTARAYVEPRKSLSETTTTREQSQPKQIYVSDTSITLQDKIMLADGTTPEISTIEVHTVVEGIEHTVVTFL
jgi:hypothetical protein